MEKYFGLTPEQKIELFLEEHNKKLNIEKFKMIGFFFFMFIIVAAVSVIVFQEFNILFIILMAILFTAGIGSESITRQKRGNTIHKVLYNETPNYITEKELKRNTSAINEILIINTKYTGKNYDGKLCFGENIIIDTTRNLPIKIISEKDIRKNQPCFLVCINSFENPVAIFSGEYLGNKYLTYNQ